MLRVCVVPGLVVAGRPGPSSGEHPVPDGELAGVPEAPEPLVYVCPVLRTVGGFQVLLQQADLPVVHGLRHTFVTFLDRDCQVDSTTTKSMSGHKDDSAFHIYTHTNDEFRCKAALALGSMIAPDPDSARCLNCKLWTMSPVDATKGACWAEADAPEVTGCVDLCGKGSFAMRMTA